MKKINIKEDIFDTNLTFYINYEWSVMMKDIKKITVKELYNTFSSAPEPQEDVEGCMLISPQFSSAFIWLKDFQPNSVAFSALIHELNHYVFHNLKIKGIKHETQSEDEVYSYYIQMLVEKFLNKFF